MQQLSGTRLFEKESVIIFDEVQLLPKARQAIKYLVADGRYKLFTSDVGLFVTLAFRDKNYTESIRQSTVRFTRREKRFH